MMSNQGATGAGGHCDIVVCCYNHSAYIEKAILSILQQDSDRLGTIHVCDDASPDGTAARVAALIDSHGLQGRVWLHARQTNVGPAINFREAVQRIQSPFIGFLDGDDHWSHPSKLRYQLALLDDHPSVVYCGHEYFFIDEQGVMQGVFPFISGTEAILRPLPNNGELEQFILNPDLLFTLNTCGFHMNAVVGRTTIMQQNLLAEWDDLKVGDWPWFWLTSEQGEVGFIKAQWAVNIKHNGSAFNDFSVVKRVVYIIQMLARLRHSQNERNRVINDREVANYVRVLQGMIGYFGAEEMIEFTQNIMSLNDDGLTTILLQ
ncbi:MAG: glycosyltransferase [Candidatus Pacebacteria bacterium]|nr:glycosyltransferase [Candidatus Paceibacterota bacterium]